MLRRIVSYTQSLVLILFEWGSYFSWFSHGTLGRLRNLLLTYIGPSILTSYFCSNAKTKLVHEILAK